MAKTRAQKQDLMNQYKELVDRGNFVVLKVNRLPANALVVFRKELAELNASFKIMKNKVFKKSVENHEKLATVDYTDQLAILDGGDDLVSALKKLDVLIEQSKADHALAGMPEDELKQYKPFEFYIGYMQDSLLDASEVAKLKDLPSRQTLLGMLVGTIAAPVTGLMNVMNGNTRNLIYALNDLKEKKQ